jgi:hypothetical protein
VVIVTDEGTLRNRLIELGIPQEIADHPTKGRYLCELLGQRSGGEEANVAQAAIAAGLSSATPRVWRKRSPAFAHAEWRARHGADEEFPEIDLDRPPEPEAVRQLRESHRLAVEICESIGQPGTWYRLSPNEVQWNVGGYNEARKQAIETAAALRAAGVHDRLTEPEPLDDIPKPRRPRPPEPDILWPPSVASEAALQRLRGPRR